MAIGAIGIHGDEAIAGGTDRDLEGEIMQMALGAGEYMKTAELFRLGRMHSSGAVPDEFRQSLPIPIRQKDGVQMVFFFAAAVATPREGVKIGTPRFVVDLNARTGQFSHLRAVTPRDFGQDHSENDIIGIFAMPPDMTVEEFMAQRDRLFVLYDALLPLYAAGSVRTDEGTISLAAEFSRLFLAQSEPPLLPYYRAIGKDFFAWLNRYAR